MTGNGACLPLPTIHDVAVQFMTPACDSLKTRNAHPARRVEEDIMNKKPLIAVVLVVVLAIVAVLVHRAAFAKESTSYRFTTVDRGDVEATVSATGTLSAV